jgi:hypothetical protein
VSERNRAVLSYDVKYEAQHKMHADIPEPEPGQHVWVIAGFWRVTPENPTQHLDSENLLSLEGPGCLECGQAYSPKIAAQPCPGDAERRVLHPDAGQP